MQPQARAGDRREERSRQLRRAAIFLVAAVLLLLAGVVLLSALRPAWNADGSCDAYDLWARVLIAACVVVGTVFAPLGLRSLFVGLLPYKAVGVLGTVLVAFVAIVTAPVEIWLVASLTDAEGPGARERFESGGDLDWD